jgi:hypothetical protein
MELVDQIQVIIDNDRVYLQGHLLPLRRCLAQTQGSRKNNSMVFGATVTRSR